MFYFVVKLVSFAVKTGVECFFLAPTVGPLCCATSLRKKKSGNSRSHMHNKGSYLFSRTQTGPNAVTRQVEWQAIYSAARFWRKKIFAHCLCLGSRSLSLPPSFLPRLSRSPPRQFSVCGVSVLRFDFF